MLLVTNFLRFPEQWRSTAGVEGRSVEAHTAAEFLAHREDRDAVFLVNCDPGLTLQLAAASLKGPRRPLISVDVVLRAPRSFKDRLSLPLKRVLLARVDHYIHYFRDSSGYERTFGMPQGRSSFVPFKANLSDRHLLHTSAEGDYVLCFGRSMRDFDTFFDAIEELPYPAAIARPDPALLAAHGARFTRALDALPANVRLLDDDGSEEAQIAILSGARLVVLPVLKSSLVASGISTCLNAMMLGKCVIGSEGPGMSDVFTHGEVVTVPAEDAAALAEAIRRVWSDDDLRLRTAAAGRAYAVAAGGEQELYARIIDNVVEWRRQCSGGPISR